jgi:hypothetical protein
MGKKTVHKPKKLLTLEERRTIVNQIKIRAAMSDISDLLYQCGANDIFERYVETGQPVDVEIPINGENRTLIIRLHGTITPKPMVNFHINNK